jgi:hypothetical protein
MIMWTKTHIDNFFMGDLTGRTRARNYLGKLGGVSFRNQFLPDQLIAYVELLSPLLKSGVASRSTGHLLIYGGVSSLLWL